MADYPYGLTLDELADERLMGDAEHCYGPTYTERDRLIAAIGGLSYAITEDHDGHGLRRAVALGFLLRDENAYRAAREHREQRRADAIDALMAKAGA